MPASWKNASMKVLRAGALFLICEDARADGPALAAPEVPLPDEVCLSALRDHGVAFTQAPPTRGVRTPIVVIGPLGSVRLVAQDKRPALMDCELARALVEAAPVFAGLAITDLVYSAAYDYRSRRDSPAMSRHSNGLAIDVHSFRGPGITYEVKRDFEPGVGQWLGLPREKSAASEGPCIGAPLTEAGRALRTLACRLKLHPAFRVIVTGDDNADHRDHFHLECYPGVSDRDNRVALGHRPAAAAPALASSSPTVAQAGATGTTKPASLRGKHRVRSLAKHHPQRRRKSRKVGDHG